MLRTRQMFAEHCDCAWVIELVNGMIILPSSIPVESNIYDFDNKFNLYVNKSKFFAAAQPLGIANRGILYKNARLWQFNMLLKIYILHLTCKITFIKFSRIRSLHCTLKTTTIIDFSHHNEHLSIHYSVLP